MKKGFLLIIIFIFLILNIIVTILDRQIYRGIMDFILLNISFTCLLRIERKEK